MALGSVELRSLSLAACMLLLARESQAHVPPLYHWVYLDYMREPATPEPFSRGEIGILQPRFWPVHMIVAYRYLNGRTLPEATRDAVYPKPVAYPGEPYRGPANQRWLNARQSVPGLPGIPYIDVYRFNQATHTGYPNCGDDAFENAIRALDQRIRTYGASSARVKDWVQAQDLVFQNCAGSPAIPPPLPANAAAAARSDRAYQIAAAHFYALQFDAAKSEFLAIANDAASPWRGFGPYLAARAMIRAGQYADALRQLESIIRDAGQPAERERARRLAGFVRTKLDPLGLLVNLGRSIASGNLEPETVNDYSWLYTTLQNDPKTFETALARDDLASWIHCLNPAEGAPCTRARERWSQTHAVRWLIAALYTTRAGDPAMNELIAAADKVPAKSPGYLSAQYYAVAALVHRGEDEEARIRTDRLLTGTWPVQARNLLLAARMKVARNYSEFLRDAVRIPAANIWGPQAGYDAKETGFDADSVQIFRNEIPLSLLADAATGDKLPAGIRRNLVVAAWTKAVLLDRRDLSKRLTPAMGAALPSMRPDLEAWLRAPESDRAFASALLLLRNPGVHPYVEPQTGRTVPPDQIHPFRSNWWYPPGNANGSNTAGFLMTQALELSAPLKELYGKDQPHARFLTQSERNAAEAETAKLASLPAAPDWMGETAFAWAQAHPNDPRSPESLHLIVRAAHYACDPGSSRIAKRAFELLHRRYAKSEWAKKTPYWY